MNPHFHIHEHEHEHHDHEAAHVCGSTCQHLGNLCLSGQCGHPEHMFAAHIALQRMLATEYLTPSEDEDHSEYSNANSKKPRKKRKALILSSMLTV